MRGDEVIRRSTRLGLKTNSPNNNGSTRIKTEVKSKYFSTNNNRAKVIKKEEEIDEVKLPLERPSAEDDKKEPLIKKRKIIKHEPIEIEIPSAQPIKPPPKNFDKIYNEVKSMRSKIITPVDTMGCAYLPTKVSGLKDGPIFRYQLLVSLMLSAQTKDEVNAQVMQILQTSMLAKGFKDGLSVDAIMETSETELDKLIFKVGFHSRKLKFIKQTTEILKLKYNSDIPKTIEEITSFPGVGPKMGYLLLQSAWDITTGIGVDVHIFRLANMWNWVPKVKNPTPENTRLELEKWLPRELWKEFNPVIVGFGQSVCQPRGRRCDLCTLPKYGRLCPNVDRALLKKVESGKDRTSSPRKVRGDLSAMMVKSEKIEDIEDLI